MSSRARRSRTRRGARRRDGQRRIGQEVFPPVMERLRRKGLAYGPLLGCEQSVTRAELRAILLVLRRAVLPVATKADCLN
eukprot:38246-Pyramimonas_sp.AAC.1